MPEPITRVKAAEGPRQAFQEGHIRRPTSRAAGVDEAVAVGGPSALPVIVPLSLMLIP